MPVQIATAVNAIPQNAITAAQAAAQSGSGYGWIIILVIGIPAVLLLSKLLTSRPASRPKPNSVQSLEHISPVPGIHIRIHNRGSVYDYSNYQPSGANTARVFYQNGSQPGDCAWLPRRVYIEPIIANLNNGIIDAHIIPEEIGDVTEWRVDRVERLLKQALSDKRALQDELSKLRGGEGTAATKSLEAQEDLAKRARNMDGTVPEIPGLPGAQPE
jgi:hypothetical protein